MPKGDVTVESKYPVTVTRQELYRQVWETPMMQLAEQYGVSANWLATICRRLNVPYPNRGYWRKKETGKKVYVKTLPKNSGKFPEQARINPTNPDAEPDPGTVERLARHQTVKELSRQLSVSIPAKIADIHPLLLQELNRQPKFAPPHIPSPAEKRLYRVLHALFTLLEPHGGSVGWGYVKRGASPNGIGYRYRHGTFLQLGEECIEYDFGEICQHFETPISPAERSRYPANRRHHHEYRPTGMMYFKFTTAVPKGFPRHWKETADRPMEAILPEIAATCIAIRPFLEKARIAREREQRRKHLIEERQRRRDHRRRLHQAQWEYFKKSAVEWGEIARARQYLNALKNKQAAPATRVGKKDMGEWLEWAEELLQSEEKDYSGHDVFMRIAGLAIQK
jgi:hypothetical protein